MRTLIHASDIHFGKVNEKVIAKLERAFVRIKPDLLIISGDITQRARLKEFEDAKQLLTRLRAQGIPNLTIPGNHDIKPVYAPLARLRDPFGLYKSMVAPISEDSHVDQELAILGINTVRVSRLKGGRVSPRELLTAEEWFKNAPRGLVRIAVTHHPLDLPPEYPKRKLAKRAAKAIDVLSRANVDLYLSGHYHRSSALHTAHRYRTGTFAAVAVQAGTLSTRERGERQSFNVIKIKPGEITVETFTWNDSVDDFTDGNLTRFVFKEGKWTSDDS
jgi:3',5'-cyclic AMP phosphodiesterase CpdA